MDSLYVVVLATIALAVACISFSTWTTVGDLRQIVGGADAHIGAGTSSEHHDWHELASRALGHIEHVPYDSRHAAHSVASHAAGALLSCKCVDELARMTP